MKTLVISILIIVKRFEWDDYEVGTKQEKYATVSKLLTALIDHYHGLPRTNQRTGRLDLGFVVLSYKVCITK